MSSAGRHYRAARASAAAASSQKPARAPVVRRHTPSRRAPPPPAFRSACAAGRRLLGERLSLRALFIALRRCLSDALGRASPAVCALQSGPLLPWPAGVVSGDGRSQPQRGRVPGPRGSRGHWPEPAVYVPPCGPLCPPSSDLPSGGLERAVRWGWMLGASSSPMAGLGGRPVGKRGQCWEARCTFDPSHRAVFAGGTVAQASTRGWVRSSGKMPSPAPPARWYLP